MEYRTRKLIEEYEREQEDALLQDRVDAAEALILGEVRELPKKKLIVGDSDPPDDDPENKEFWEAVLREQQEIYGIGEDEEDMRTQEGT
jgi:hypothetical protein